MRKTERRARHAVPLLTLLVATTLFAQDAPKGKYVDPVPHQLITQPYRVCQDLDELTARIDNLYRKPFDKVLDKKTGVMQPETIFFKDTKSGHEVMGLTRELSAEMCHNGLGRPAWNCNGSVICFMGNRGFIDADGKLVKAPWAGYKYVMDADYTNQRTLIIDFPKDEYKDLKGRAMKRATGIDGPYYIYDPVDPESVYFAVNDDLWRIRVARGTAVATGELVCKLATPHRKIVHEISDDGRLLIQDVNADVDRTTKKPAYMPEIHLVDTRKKPGEKGFYYHHPLDYGLAEIKDDKGKVVHDAANNYQVHGIGFADGGKAVRWNYGPRTSVGEPLGWRLDVTNGLDGTPTHPKIIGGSGRNPWDQYESHGAEFGGGSTSGLYFAGPVKDETGKQVGGWGIWLRDYADDKAAPKFITTAPGGHIAGGNCLNPNVWAAHIGSEWRDRVKESDAIVWGDAKGWWEALCYSYSDVRGGVSKDRKTGEMKWTGMDSNAARPYSSIPRPELSPDGTKVWFHSAMLMPYDEFNGIYVAVTKRPDPPTDLKIGGGPGITLQWKPAAMSHETKGYHVYRGTADGKDFLELTSTVVLQTTYTDGAAERGKTYTYAVTAEEWSTLESACTSNLLTVTAAKPDAKSEPNVTGFDEPLPQKYSSAPGITGWDKTPPPAVTGFTVTKEADEDGQYRLKWDKSPATDLRYYNVYFSTKGKPEVSQKRLIVSPLASMTGYLDWSAPADARPVFYAITAVDRQGNESAPAHAELH